MDRYICIKEFSIECVNDDGAFTDNYKVIEKDSEWTVDKDPQNNMIGGDIRLIKDNSDNSLLWIEISTETLNECFYKLESNHNLCISCWFFHGNELTELGYCSKHNNKTHALSDMNSSFGCYASRQERGQEFKEFIDELDNMDEDVVSYEFKDYIINFEEHESIKLRIKQDVNRPNNPEDDSLIEEYVTNNYALGTEFTVIELDRIKTITI